MRRLAEEEDPFGMPAAEQNPEEEEEVLSEGEPRGARLTTRRSINTATKRAIRQSDAAIISNSRTIPGQVENLRKLNFKHMRCELDSCLNFERACHLLASSGKHHTWSLENQAKQAWRVFNEEEDEDGTLFVIDRPPLKFITECGRGLHLAGTKKTTGKKSLAVVAKEEVKSQEIPAWAAGLMLGMAGQNYRQQSLPEQPAPPSSAATSQPAAAPPSSPTTLQFEEDDATMDEFAEYLQEAKAGLPRHQAEMAKIVPWLKANLYNLTRFASFNFNHIQLMVNAGIAAAMLDEARDGLKAFNAEKMLQEHKQEKLRRQAARGLQSLRRPQLGQGLQGLNTVRQPIFESPVDESPPYDEYYQGRQAGDEYFAE